MRADILFVVASVFALPTADETEGPLEPVKEENMLETSFQAVHNFRELNHEETKDFETQLKEQPLPQPFGFIPLPEISHSNTNQNRRRIHELGQPNNKRDNDLIDIITHWGVNYTTYAKLMADKEYIHDLFVDKKVSRGTLIYIDALLLQSIAGDNKFLPPIGHSPYGLQYDEWLQWNKLKGMSKKDAAKRMIDTVETVIFIAKTERIKQNSETDLKRTYSKFNLNGESLEE